LLREYLKSFIKKFERDPFHAGARYGYNWVKYIMLPSYLRDLQLNEGLLSSQQDDIAALLKLLEERGKRL